MNVLYVTLYDIGCIMKYLIVAQCLGSYCGGLSVSKETSRDVPSDTNYIKSVSKRLLAFDFLVVFRYLAGHIINLKLFINSYSMSITHLSHWCLWFSWCWFSCRRGCKLLTWGFASCWFTSSLIGTWHCSCVCVEHKN